MAFRTWAKLLGATLGVGALAGASQLGLAYGLGILRLTRVLDVTTRDQWVAQLAWVAWIAMTATAAGALVGRVLLPPRSGAGTRIATALAAGLGGAVVVPLTMQPARTAQVEGVHPIFVIGVCAGLGATVGVFAAYAALSRAVARWSLTTVGVAVWVIAIASVAPSLAPGDPLPAVRLGVFDAHFLAGSAIRRTAVFTMPALALICGAAVGWAARRRAMSTLAIALSGLPGPALLTMAYLIAGPGAGQAQYEMVPYWAAMTAAGAGVLGSVLVAVLRRIPSTLSEEARPGGPGGAPTPNRPPLPRRDVQPESAIAQAGVAAAPWPADQLTPSDTAVFAKPPPEPGYPAGPGPTIHGPGPAIRGPGPGVQGPGPGIPGTAPGTPPFDGFAPPHPGPAQHPTGVARPQPRPMNAPPATSTPITPPLPVTPAPRPRGHRHRQADGEFVDWVSGLGNG